MSAPGLGAPGKFITFEGIEGVGKSTQMALTAAALARTGVDHIVTREPGGTPLAERIRGIVVDVGEEFLPPAAELLLMFAARSVHLTNRIEPQLAAGTHVLCDRFTDATYAYQGAGRGTQPITIAMLERFVQGARRPDLTLLLDLPVPIALARARARGAADRFEREREEFFLRVRNEYLKRAVNDPQRFVIIDAKPEPAAVLAQIGVALSSRLSINMDS